MACRQYWNRHHRVCSNFGIAAIIGSIMGLVSSYPGIRLRGDYLAIVLLALGEGIRIIGNNYAPLVGGSIGVHIPDPLSFLAGDLRFPIATIALGGIAAAELYQNLEYQQTQIPNSS